ncbi:MAG TPA: type II toxin-antitoxin system PemK/MazF family toxin [Bryobacterales bacterium]|nr:type II toxin-antitoxin system PemK/MazF family toxin [Bryobacterales bacterium]
MRRGEIWWASLRAPLGSGPGYRRPVLIVQANEFNQSRIRMVLVVAMTSNLRLAAAPGNVKCSRKDTGLPKDSVANVSQVVTLDKSFLTERIAALPSRLLEQVEDGLRLVLAL